LPIVGESHFACKVAGRVLSNLLRKSDREGEKSVFKRQSVSPSSTPTFFESVKNSHPPPLSRL